MKRWAGPGLARDHAARVRGARGPGGGRAAQLGPDGGRRGRRRRAARARASRRRSDRGGRRQRRLSLAHALRLAALWLARLRGSGGAGGCCAAKDGPVSSRLMRQHGFDTTWLLVAGDSGDRGSGWRCRLSQAHEGAVLSSYQGGHASRRRPLEAASCGCEHANQTCRYELHTNGEFAKRGWNKLPCSRLDMCNKVPPMGLQSCNQATPGQGFMQAQVHTESQKLQAEGNFKCALGCSVWTPTSYYNKQDGAGHALAAKGFPSVSSASAETAPGSDKAEHTLWVNTDPPAPGKDTPRKS